jgi:electron-transferring-flavoprotein dehydrogenase
MHEEPEVLEVDALIVGGGPAGLAAAYHLARLTGVGRSGATIAVLEKSREIGSHIISGAVMDPRGLSELIPDWQTRGAPVESPVTRDDVYYLTSGRGYRLPVTPPPLRNSGCYVVSLNRLIRWLGEQVEEAGVELLPGFSGAGLWMEGTRLVGVRTGDKGRNKAGERKPNFEPGIRIRARLCILAEGARGSLTKDLVARLELDRGRNPQVYSVGVKEVWEVSPAPAPGRVIHTMGFPLSSREFGGGFLYTMAEGRVAVGLVVGLDYADPALDPHERFQAFKTHPLVNELIRGGQMTSYGARAIPEGGYFSLPRCHFDGGLIVGDGAGFLNSMRLKGIHLAIKSGMLAAETAARALSEDDVSEAGLAGFASEVEASWIREELWGVRNFHQGFRGGLWSGLAHAALQMATAGRGTRARYPGEAGHARMERLGSAGAAGRRRIAFDGKLTFDRLSDVHSSGTRHEEDQPSHLIVTSPEICHPRCTREYGNPCQYFCPAAVYEMADLADGDRELRINASNCVHCKACDIMDPYQVIEWVTPEGGDGPDYRYL